MKEFSAWQNFYVIVGSSAGALIGLQFVMISLIGRLPTTHSDGSDAGHAFSTPTVVHFTAVLVLAAAGCAPWRNATSLGIVWGAGGVVGLLYEISVVRTMLRQNAYRPQAEDWIFHAVMPLIAYGTLAFAGFYELKDLYLAMFAIGGAVLMLLVIGIHNAWDAATWHVFHVLPKQAEREARKEARTIKSV